jgi:hypothetical protein
VQNASVKGSGNGVLRTVFTRPPDWIINIHMINRLFTAIAFLLWAMVFTVNAQTSTGNASSSSSGGNLPGKQIAQMVSTITGVAISPLLGVGVVGANAYFKAKTPEEKAKLPWFANPMFWVRHYCWWRCVFSRTPPGQPCRQW